MDGLMFILLIGIFAFIVVKNFSLIKRYKENKGYIDIYKKALHNEENSHQQVLDYVENDKSVEFKNKVRIVQIYNELENDINCETTLKDIDFKPLFYKKSKLDNELIKLNSDSLIFLILTIAKAYEKEKLEVIDTLVNKLKENAELENRVEYQTVLAVAKALKKEDDCGNEFMKNLLDGNYTDYQYDRSMIGLYKRCSAALLAFNNEEFDEFFKNDLYEFAKIFIGQCLLSSLGLYDTYKQQEETVAEEAVEENNQEENKE